MILTYLTHKKINITKGKVTVIATNSPIVYGDLIQGFKEIKTSLICLNEENEKIKISECFEFIGDPLLSNSIEKIYLNKLIDNFIKKLDEESRNQIFEKYIQLENTLQDKLLLDDIPLTLTPVQDIKKFLKLEKIHIEESYLMTAYDIIETVLKIYQECGLETIPIICNGTNYLNKNQLSEINNLVKQTNQSLILIEFSDNKLSAIPKSAQFYYIDEDFIDWY